jgi:hypothetical protein
VEAKKVELIEAEKWFREDGRNGVMLVKRYKLSVER